MRGQKYSQMQFSPYRTRTRSEIAMLNIEYLFIHYLFITNLSTDHVYVVYLYKTTSVCTLGTYLAYHLKKNCASYNCHFLIGKKKIHSILTSN